MIASILLSCVLTVGQASDRTDWQLSPQLTPGLELVYRGVFMDEALILNVQHQRHYQLESNMLVLGGNPKDWQVAMITSLSIQDGAQALGKKEGPTSVRLEMVNVDQQGRVRLNEKKLLDVPLDGPPTLEGGFLVPVPLVRVGKHFLWQVGEDNRPVQRWQVVGTEPCGDATCIKVTCLQHSEDWEKPRADQVAWRRRDTVWLIPQMNVAQKVERIIERRDPARLDPTHRLTVRYELTSRLAYPGNLFAERKQEIMQAKKFHADAQPLVAKPAQFRLEIDGLLQRVTAHLARPGTLHYRKTYVHVKNLLETAKSGDAAAPRATEEPNQALVEALTIGQKAPNFAVSCFTSEHTFRLQGFLGKPVLVVFYNPATPTGGKLIRDAKQLSEAHGESIAIMAMAVTQDADLVRRQHKELRLKFPILDGNGMRLTFGALQTPRVVLLDRDGLVMMAQSGWGYPTPDEIDVELQRCLRLQQKQPLLTTP